MRSCSADNAWMHINMSLVLISISEISKDIRGVLFAPTRVESPAAVMEVRPLMSRERRDLQPAAKSSHTVLVLGPSP